MINQYKSDLKESTEKNKKLRSSLQTSVDEIYNIEDEYKQTGERLSYLRKNTEKSK